MNLQTASDFEINKAVAESLGYIVKDQVGDMATAFLFDPPFDIGYEGVDYCNQWQDAGPIIQKNNIGILPPDDLTSGWMGGSQNQDFWCFNENPLRAAMECYLMIKGVGS